MKRFMLLYVGPATPPGEMSDDDAQDEMQLWVDWMDGLGDALIEPGAPTGESDVVTDDGTDEDSAEVTGYTIVEASDMSEARAMCENHPFLREETGDFSIHVFELMPTPEGM